MKKSKRDTRNYHKVQRFAEGGSVEDPRSKADDILKDVMSRDNLPARMRRSMGDAQSLTMGMPNQRSK